MATETAKKGGMNPHAWQDPDEVGASEYRAILEHAAEVWDSNPDESAEERGDLVRGSLEEMREWPATILGRRVVAAPRRSSRILIAAGPAEGPIVMYTMTNCAKCGKRIRQDKAVTSTDTNDKVWEYCSERCERRH